MSEQALHSIDLTDVTPEHDLYSDKDDGTISLYIKIEKIKNKK